MSKDDIRDREEIGRVMSEELKELKEEIEKLKKQRPELTEAVEELEKEIPGFEAMASAIAEEKEAPGEEIPGEDEKMLENLDKEIGQINEAIMREPDTFQRERGEVRISTNVKKKLIIYAKWLHGLEKWLLWLASRKWVPKKIRKKLRNLGKTITAIANLLTWIARKFCEENPL